MVGAEPNEAREARPKQGIGVGQRCSTDSEKNTEQSQIEQAADQFDAFAWQMPKVIKAKLNAFMKRGFRAILMDDAETKPAEEKMIGSLVKGLQAMGVSLSEDLSRPNARSQEEHPVKKQPKNQ